MPQLEFYKILPKSAQVKIFIIIIAIIRKLEKLIQIHASALKLASIQKLKVVPTYILLTV